MWLGIDQVMIKHFVNERLRGGENWAVRVTDVANFSDHLEHHFGNVVGVGPRKRKVS